MADNIAMRKSSFSSAYSSRKRRIHQASVRDFGRRVSVNTKPEKYPIMNKQNNQEWIEYIHARFHEDGIKVTHIAKELNICEVPTKRGGKWSHKQVSRILNTPN
jgi:hypothetical protein